MEMKQDIILKPSTLTINVQTWIRQDIITVKSGICPPFGDMISNVKLLYVCVQIVCLFDLRSQYESILKVDNIFNKIDHLFINLKQT